MIDYDKTMIQAIIAIAYHRYASFILSLWRDEDQNNLQLFQTEDIALFSLELKDAS